jgi:hypothetical protein
MVPTFNNKTLITDLSSMNPPDSRVVLLFYHPRHSIPDGTNLYPEHPMAEEHFRLISRLLTSDHLQFIHTRVPYSRA